MINDPFASLGILVERSGDRPVFLGTAFAFHRPDVLVTAAHCVDGRKADQLGVAVVSRRLDLIASVVQVDRCPPSDVALLHVQPTSHVTFHALRGAAPPDADYGAEFAAYGFSEDVMANEDRVPTARVFRGHFQRFFVHSSHLGYSYAAGEMSIPAPAGLSGGPVVPVGGWDRAVGVVTENFESTKYLHSLQEYEDRGRRISETLHQVINYGLCAVVGEPWVAERTEAWPRLGSR